MLTTVDRRLPTGDLLGTEMRRIGSLQLVVCSLPPGAPLGGVSEALRRVGSESAVRVIDAIYVERDRRGALTLRQVVDLGAGRCGSGDVLWPLLGEVGEAVPSPPTRYEGVNELGFDLEAIERIPYEIPIGCSAMVALLEAAWVGTLLGAVRAVEGAPVALGFIESEVMLVMGPPLAVAEAADRVPTIGDEQSRT